MPLSLLPASPADMESIVRIQFAAFHPNDALHILLFPAPHPITTETIQKTAAKQLKAWDDDRSHITWLKIVDTETKEIIAAAKWYVWPPGEVEEKKRWPDKIEATWISDAERGLNAGKGVDDREYVEWCLEQFFSRRRSRVQGPCLLLDMCFCDPNHHRKGAGKLLVQWGTKKADELGVKAFVESSLTGVRLYQSCGFKIIEDVVMAGGNARVEWKEYKKIEYKFMYRAGPEGVAN